MSFAPPPPRFLFALFFFFFSYLIANGDEAPSGPVYNLTSVKGWRNVKGNLLGCSQLLSGCCCLAALCEFLFRFVDQSSLSPRLASLHVEAFNLMTFQGTPYFFSLLPPAPPAPIKPNILHDDRDNDTFQILHFHPQETGEWVIHLTPSVARNTLFKWRFNDLILVGSFALF